MSRYVVKERRAAERFGLCSGGDGGQPDDGGNGDVGEGLKAPIAPGGSPFVGGLEHECANEADDGVVVGEDPHHVGAALDFAVHPKGFKGIWGECLRERALPTGQLRQAPLFPEPLRRCLRCGSGRG